MSTPNSQPYFIHQIKVGPWDNFVHLIGDRATRSCAVVDPAWDLAAILHEAQKLDLSIDHVLCTHSHFDHVDQVEALLAHRDIPVHMLQAEIDFADFRCENLKPAHSGDILTLGKDTQIRFMHTPGHTPGSVCYGLNDSVICGDTLFVKGCGRCDFVGGDPNTMFATLQRLTQELAADTILYPGHDYGDRPTSTVSRELEHNPWLGYSTVEEFRRHRMAGKTPNSPLPPKPDWTAATTQDKV